MAARLSLALLFVLAAVAGRAAAQDYDFFFLVLQWPGSYCDTKQSCCYPKSGKPAADFGIHGLWPNRNDGTYPQNCNPNDEFDPSKVRCDPILLLALVSSWSPCRCCSGSACLRLLGFRSRVTLTHWQVSDLMSSLRAKWPTLACPSSDGLTFWGHEWDKHGTCASDIFDEHSYFQAALSLRDQLGVLSALTSAGVNPDGGYYTLGQIKGAIQQGTGFLPFVECNRDESGNSQLYQLYFCINASGDSFIECPVSPGGRACGNRIEFPAF
ncbi:hypothetical protein HU200_005303 [Digitaria exilis]|uniref:Uncharacterized protein n=1 Tax=Digitaria exilis TaxID=1010633 RepID=A0A835KT34_9POAL|nr:hypothetical protein HU200_005303 [Digitaria exilis]